MIEIKTLIQSFHLQQAVDRTTRTCYLKQNQYYGEKFLIKWNFSSKVYSDSLSAVNVQTITITINFVESKIWSN